MSRYLRRMSRNLDECSGEIGEIRCLIGPYFAGYNINLWMNVCKN